jgi:hypothetical protein
MCPCYGPAGRVPAGPSTSDLKWARLGQRLQLTLSWRSSLQSLAFAPGALKVPPNITGPMVQV